MRALIFSDIHTEINPWTPKFTDCDVVIAAGDIGVNTEGVYWLRGHFRKQQIIYVAGNHEHYSRYMTGNGTYYNNMEVIDLAGRNMNVKVLDNSSIQLSNGTMVHGSTLWTALPNPMDRFRYSLEMNDAKHVKQLDQYTLFDGEAVHNLHMEARTFLESVVKKGDIVVTHHSPSMLSCDEAYKYQTTNCYYHNNMEEFILDTKPSLWVHGHSHSFKDYMLGDTRIICNPRGYRTSYASEKTGFKHALIVDI